MSPLEPTLPQPKPINVETERTALLVLDLTEDCADPNHPSHKLVSGISELLDRARAAGVLIVFTISLFLKGKPSGRVYPGFNRRPSEVVLFPDGFDKFAGGELESLLKHYEDIDTLIITGCRSNICVLHTAIRAARELNYKVIIPIDGLAAVSDYEEQYTLFHLANAPGLPPDRFTFTKLDMIGFQATRKENIP